MSTTKLLPLIVAISGKLGTGKDYITDNYLIPYLKSYGLNNFTRMAFADQVKVNVASRHGIDITRCLLGDKSSDLRLMLQKEGTEEGRNKYGENIWVDTLENWIKLRTIRDNVQVVLVTDCRFPNEAKWVEDHGGLLIRIEAPNRNNQRLDNESKGDVVLKNNIASHSSETALDNYKFKFVINNDPHNKDNVPALINMFVSMFHMNTKAKNDRLQ